MKKSLFLLSVGLTAMSGLVQAAAINGGGCVGQPITGYSCSGTIDTFTDNPGTLVASLVTPINYYSYNSSTGQQTTTFAGNLISAAYSPSPNGNGQAPTNLDFYYQFQGASTLPFPIGELTIVQPAQTIAYNPNVNVGQRQSASGLSGFLNTSASLDTVAMNGDGSFLVFFNSDATAANQNSPIFESQSQYANFSAAGIIGITSTPQSGRASADATGLLAPAPVPEPATWGLLGVSFSLIGALCLKKKSV